jgi:hypothetical protein
MHRVPCTSVSRTKHFSVSNQNTGMGTRRGLLHAHAVASQGRGPSPCCRVSKSTTVAFASTRKPSVAEHTQVTGRGGAGSVNPEKTSYRRGPVQRRVRPPAAASRSGAAGTRPTFLTGRHPFSFDHASAGQLPFACPADSSHPQAVQLRAGASLAGSSSEGTNAGRPTLSGPARANSIGRAAAARETRPAAHFICYSHSLSDARRRIGDWSRAESRNSHFR